MTVLGWLSAGNNTDKKELKDANLNYWSAIGTQGTQCNLWLCYGDFFFLAGDTRERKGVG